MDYRKFDSIVDSDSEGEDHVLKGPPPAQPTAASSSFGKVRSTTKKGTDGRFKFEHDGLTIYEWEQSLEEVNIYITPPPGLTRNLIEVEISHLHLKVGVKGSPPFIDEDTGGPVKVKESMWTLADGVMNINLQKMNKAEAWHCALKGRSGEEIDEMTKEEVKKKLMLERFQEEVSKRKDCFLLFVMISSLLLPTKFNIVTIN